MTDLRTISNELPGLVYIDDEGINFDSRLRQHFDNDEDMHWFLDLCCDYQEGDVIDFDIVLELYYGGKL